MTDLVRMSDPVFACCSLPGGGGNAVKVRFAALASGGASVILLCMLTDGSFVEGTTLTDFVNYSFTADLPVDYIIVDSVAS